MRTIPLYGKIARGRVALVDDADYKCVMAYRWNVQERRRPNGTIHGPYVFTNIRRPDGKRTVIYMHTLLTGWRRVDHRNGNPLDNTRRNMRKATNAQNQHNKRAQHGRASRYKGVTWAKRLNGGKWRATIKANGRYQNLGLFTGTPEGEITAARTYDAAALEAFGEFARPNFT